MKSFNNSAGTTSTEFGLGVGTGSEVRQFALSSTGNTPALDREGNAVTVSGIEFYDAKVIAKNGIGEIVAKQLRGTVNGTTVTRIEDLFQEDFAAEVYITSNGGQLTVNCVGAGNYTIYITMTKVAE